MVRNAQRGFAGERESARRRAREVPGEEQEKCPAKSKRKSQEDMKKIAENKTLKKSVNIVYSLVVTLVAAVAICMMLYTVIAVTTVDQKDRSILGYKLMVVLSDSMSATDFNAGDLIMVKEIDPAKLQAGDIIAFTSQAEENFGETVAHKIRRFTADAEGNPGFITYGTTTGVDDEYVVRESDILGKYQMRIPAVGRLFSFIKTVPGYLLCILLPFMLLLLFQGINCVKVFREYREADRQEIASERDKLKAEREENLKLKEELASLKAELENVVTERNVSKDIEESCS